MTLIEFSQLITPDGVVYPLDGIVDRALVVSPSGEGMPPIEYITQKGPQQHGETVISYRLQPRIIQLLFRRNARSRQAYWDNRKELIDALRPNRITVGSVPQPCVLRKIFPDGTIRDIDVLISQGPNFEPSGTDSWDEWAFTEGLRLIAHDPPFRDPTAVNISPAVDPGNTELSFPAGFPISFGASNSVVTINHSYVGTWMTYPVITLTGPFLNVLIENLTTEEDLRFNHELLVGERAVIDLRYGHKTVVDPDLSDTDPNYNLIGSIEGDLGTFHIEAAPMAPNGVNQLRFTVAVPYNLFGSIVMQYYARYTGI